MTSNKLQNRFLVIGLGSPIMTDDAIGLKIAEAIEELHLPDVDTLQEAIGGLEILPMIHGYRFAIIVDAIQTYQYKPGTVMIFNPEDFDSTIKEASAHDVNLATAMKMGRDMDPDIMPESVRFVAVEVEDIQTMSESMTEKVAAAVEHAKDAVLYIMNELRCPTEPDQTS
ncbi:MAG: hydrogenase maturation protease [Candidatus Methanomethylophilaceae archaeon]|nr:hydrogenase maturation protease [Candidatus Methanomethylophilaceae archaeon]MDD3379182.1 hydrogenase maturation protease [Candidatus Methanomethylophilaceae archaeon]MDY0224409.1 hydrogenase maturation protease [Candidatus Methanomethylophilaceae archaeon]